MITGLESPYAMSALGDEGLLMHLVRKMADFPMEPPLAKMLIESHRAGVFRGYPVDCGPAVRAERVLPTEGEAEPG